MPTYEYICDACGTEFEKFQSITAAPVTLCPSCGKEKVRRKISGGAAILFKGGGFYETDYRSEKYKQSAKADADAGKPAEAKSDAKSDPKSDAKSGDAKPADAKPSESKPAEAKPAASATEAKVPSPAKTESKST